MQKPPGGVAVSAGGFLITAFWKSLHDFLSEGWGYAVDFTITRWNECNSHLIKTQMATNVKVIRPIWERRAIWLARST
jgi:hypothetical protein